MYGRDPEYTVLLDNTSNKKPVRIAPHQRGAAECVGIEGFEEINHTAASAATGKPRDKAVATGLPD